MPIHAGVPELGVLDRIRKVLAEMETPSWYDTPPLAFGDTSVGSIKAAEWRGLYEVYIPISLISLWGVEMPEYPPALSRALFDLLGATMSLHAPYGCYAKSRKAISEPRPFGSISGSGWKIHP